MRVERQQQIPLKEWILNNISYIYKSWKDILGCIQFIIILWEIWKHRNEISFGKRRCNPGSIIYQVNYCVNRWITNRNCHETCNESKSIHQNDLHTNENNEWQTGSDVQQDLVEVTISATWKKKQKITKG